MIKAKLHQHFCSCSDRLAEWYCERIRNLGYPVYSSYDIRDSGFKISNVDANIYPAGFNNICQTDRDNAGELAKSYLEGHYKNSTKIMLLTEEHTNNPYYWDNVISIRGILEEAGKQVLVSIPKPLEQPLLLKSAKGVEIEVHAGFGNSEAVNKFKPDLVISNNDFSQAHEAWAETIDCPINPPRGMGWYQRKKSRYFKYYNQLVNDFSQLVEMDPFLLNVKTEFFENFSPEEPTSLQKLSDSVDQMLESLRADYAQRKISTEPFVFVKNNSGTYGLAVIRVGSGKEVLDWNYKSRKKMKAAKGGRDVEDVIIQEGIPSRVQTEGSTAEPVIYMIGSDLAGGFLRTHAEKDATESLNSPGAVYKRLCVSDLNVSLTSHPLENVYGWSARLGLLAIGLEAQEMKVEFSGFEKKCFES